MNTSYVILSCLQTLRSLGKICNVNVLPKERSALAESVFGCQAFGQIEKFCNIGCNPFGISETRLLLDGAYLVAGVKVSEVPGTTLKNKIESLLTGPGMERFVGLAQEPLHGFMKVHDEVGTLVSTPENHIVLTCGLFEEDGEGASGIRWSYLRGTLTKADIKSVGDTCNALVTIYPALADIGYKDWTESLINHVAPLASA